MKEFKGRVIIPGECKGKALATKTGFNILATYVKSLMDDDGTCVCNDVNNTELYGKSLKGEIICLPQAIGSTSSGFMIQSIAAADIAPKALLFARKADSLALAGILIADVWENTKIITIDGLGDDFLDAVKESSEVAVYADGRVVIS